MRLCAGGRADLLSYEAERLSPDVLENRLLGLGLGALDRTVASWTEARNLLSRVRTVAVLFEDVRWPEMATWSHDRLDEVFAFALNTAPPALTTLLELARMFALHFGIGFALDAEAPVAWFVNLESLFEDAVRQSLATAAGRIGQGLRVYDWEKAARYVFVAPEQLYRAEPDAVVLRGGNVAAVLDMKYKELDGDPDSADVYQILAHARAWETGEAVLVYPGDTYVSRLVGTTAEGTRLRIVRLNLVSLAGDAEALLRSMPEIAVAA
jgi:hypothetical protein